MRRRATFIDDGNNSFDPTQAKLDGHGLKHPGVKGAREEKLTFAFNELPADLLDVLKQSHELHIKWTSETVYKTTVPFVSRSVPGLHVHYTPSEHHQNDLLCHTLRNVFSKDLKCKSVESSFTRPSLVSERFTSSTSSQFYSPLLQLDRFIAYLQSKICPQSDITCIHTASFLGTVDYLDIDFDSISHTLRLTAFWSQPPQLYIDPVTQSTVYGTWPLDISSRPNDKVEVGFLTSTSSEALDAHELQMEGLLADISYSSNSDPEDEQQQPPSPRKLKPVMFSFPSRHHSLPSSQSIAQTYNVSFVQPTGLHPTLQITFPSAVALQQPTSKLSDSTCSLHTYLNLPSAIFADQYAFPTNTLDPLFESAHHIRLLRSISGELDLEAPAYVIDKWGSSVLLELSTPEISTISNTNSNEKEWTITIPLHLRYLPPSNQNTHAQISIPYPQVFWACTAEEGTKFPVNPFDRIHLGYDSLFGARSMFYHLTPMGSSSVPPVGDAIDAKSGGRLMTYIDVPVLSTRSVGGDQVIQGGTLIVVVIGFLWVLMKLWPALVVVGGGGSGERGKKRSVEGKKRQ